MPGCIQKHLFPPAVHRKPRVRPAWHEYQQNVVQQPIRFAGELPQNIEDLLRIPGVGPYTAGAIASIAFNKRAAVVDGNVVRVFSRLAALTGHGKSPALHRQCWKLAEALLDPERPSAFNQALMELGATVCTPLAPACSRCPVRTACKAQKLAAAGTVTSVTGFPAKQASQKPRRHRVLALAAVVNAKGAWMLVRRPPNGLLAGQLEFPAIELDQTQETVVSTQAISCLRELLADFGLCCDLPLTTLGAPIEHVSRLSRVMLWGCFLGCSLAQPVRGVCVHTHTHTSS